MIDSLQFLFLDNDTKQVPDEKMSKDASSKRKVPPPIPPAPAVPQVDPKAQPVADIVQLFEGDTIGSWNIKKKLGEGSTFYLYEFCYFIQSFLGGFGAVYLVKDSTGHNGTEGWLSYFWFR